MESQIFGESKIINSECYISDLIVYSREALTKTCYEILNDFSNIKFVNDEMTEKKFL